MCSQANVRAGKVLRPPIRALPSVIVVDEGSRCARWKSGVDCSLRVERCSPRSAPRKPVGWAGEEPEEHKCSQKFIRPQWEKIFKELWSRPKTTADLGTSLKQIPYSNNIWLLEDKIQDWGMYLFTISYGSYAVDQRSGVGWISGWSEIFAFYQRNSRTRFRGIRRENCFSTELNHPEYPLQEKGQSGGNESSKRGSLSPRKTDFFPDLRLLPGHWSQWFCRELCRPTYSCFSKWWYSGIRFEMGRNLLSMTQIPSDDILEGLYTLRIRESEKLKTRMELYNMEIHQKTAGPDYHRLKTMVKRSIEQNLRMKKFEARNVNYNTNAVVKGQGTKQREQRSLGDCWQWKANGQCSKGDNCSFWHDMNKRAKSTQPNHSLRSCTRQSVKRAPTTKNPRGRSPSGKMARLPCKDCLKGTCTTLFCGKWHPPECLFNKSEKGCRFVEKCSYAHRQVDEQPSKKSEKNGELKCSGHVENYTTIGLRTSGYGAVEVFIDFAEELKHTETNPMCSIH